MARSKVKIKLDSPGIAAILKSDEVAIEVHDRAEMIAERVAAHPALVRNEITDQVEVEDYVTDRAASSVTITHAAGLGIEGKYGPLSQAAGGAE